MAPDPQPGMASLLLHRRNYNMYKIIIDTETLQQIAIERLLDGAYIPLDAQNIDYQAYLAWAADGNTPLSTGE